MSETLRFVSDYLQLMAIGFMSLVYILRIRWLLRFKAGRERQAPSGSADTNPRKGILYSWANIASPWAMESTRQNPFFYAQFVLFHLAVAANIIMSFIIPYAPALMRPGFVFRGLQGLFLVGCLIGCYRLYRRLSDPFIRQISTPDDYFLSPPPDGLVIRLHLGGPQPSGSRGRSFADLFHHDSLLSGLCAVQQDFSLSLLSLYPILFRQEHGVPRSLPNQTRLPAQIDQSLIMEGP